MHWVASATVVVLPAAAACACPMCKDGTTTANETAASDPSTPPAQAAAAPLDFNASVYVMLGVVTVVAATAGRAMVKAVRG